LSEWKRGDVIVFVAPGKTDPYIKRVIWLPGETVKVENDEVIICNNQTGAEVCTPLVEDYLPEGLKTEARCEKSEFVVDNGLFVMGDNRGLSTDSLCCFGVKCYEWANYLVPENYIIGKVYLRLFPRFQLF
jgi:signal peptidase I